MKPSDKGLTFPVLFGGSEIDRLIAARKGEDNDLQH